MHELDYPLPEIAFHGLDSVLLKERVQAAFFSQHGFALHEQLHPVRLKDTQNDLPVLPGVLRPVDDRPVCGRLAFKLLQQLLQMTVRIHLERAGGVSESLPLRETPAHPVTLPANHPERLVMPFRMGSVLEEFRRGY